MKSERTALAGWGGTAPSVATVIDVRPDELDDADALLSQIGPRGAIARGLGRSYGDPAQNGGGTVIRLQPGADPIRLHADTGTITVDAGVSLDDLLRVIIPQGWFVPVSPGTRFVTVGGAIASDVHGKGHHVDGTFGAHVSEIEMLLADGSVRVITAASDPDLWWATIGGMGLTGLILRATFDLIPIETQHILVVNERVPNFDSLLERMVADDHLYRYSVAWIDLIASGKQLGRAALGRGTTPRSTTCTDTTLVRRRTRSASIRPCSPTCLPVCRTCCTVTPSVASTRSGTARRRRCTVEPRRSPGSSTRST